MTKTFWLGLAATALCSTAFGQGKQVAARPLPAGNEKDLVETP